MVDEPNLLSLYDKHEAIRANGRWILQSCRGEARMKNLEPITTEDRENSGAKQDGRWRPGQSGNPLGKPKGARHRTTLLAEKLMQDDAEAVVSAVLNAAKNGDMTAARIVVDRLCPARKDTTINFSLPQIESAADAAGAMAAILSAVAAGDLTPAEAETVTKLVETHLRALEACDFEKRLSDLEARAK